MPDLLDKLAQIKALGYIIKLDSNGSRPEVLRVAVEQGLVDYVAMDIKNSKEKYALTIGTTNFKMEDIEESVNFLIHDFDEGLIDHLHLFDAILVFEWHFFATHNAIEFCHIIRDGPIQRDVGERSLSAPTGRGVDAIDERLDGLFHLFIRKVIRFDERGEIGIEAAEGLGACPFVLHVEKFDKDDEATALREIKEETSIDARILSKETWSIDYSPKDGVAKRVVFFIADCEKTKIKVQPEEVTACYWLSPEDAIRTVSHESDKKIIAWACGLKAKI